MISQITLLDGGVGQEVNRRASQETSHPQWSVKVMLDEPEIVTQVHTEFLQAGAKVMTLNNYAATPTRMKKYNMQDQFAHTHQLAVDCANEAIAAAGIARDQIDIAGCLPPLAASYVTEVAPPYAQALDEYQQLIAQQESAVDLFLVETMSNLEELRAALDGLAHAKQAAYVGLTLKDDGSNCLRSGQPLHEAIAMLHDYQASAVLINCCYPEAVDRAMQDLAQSSLRFGAYANGFKSVEPLEPGTTVDQLEHREELTPQRYTDHCLRWIEAGASIIGGCCEISPSHIAHLRDALVSGGKNLSRLSEAGKPIIGC